MTIHRFRALLAPHGDWIFVAESGGYGCSAEIQVLGASVENAELAELETPLAEGEVPELSVAPAAHRAAPAETVLSRGLEFLANGERFSVRVIARSLGISESTALRALRHSLRPRAGYTLPNAPSDLASGERLAAARELNRSLHGRDCYPLH